MMSPLQEKQRETEVENKRVAASEIRTGNTARDTGKKVLHLSEDFLVK